VLTQFALLPMPLMDAQVAVAVPAELRAATANAPDATAPRTTPRGSLFLGINRGKLFEWFMISLFLSGVDF
jgi:hypothetical protein